MDQSATTSNTQGIAWVEQARARSPRLGKELHLGDRIFKASLKALAWLIVAILGLMAILIFKLSWPAFQKFGLSFFWTTNWDSWAAEFGALALIQGTVWSSILALTLALPVSIGVAIFLTELAPGWLARPVGLLVEMLAAIPSIVYGLWGLYVMVPWLRENIQPWLSTHLGSIFLFRGTPIGVGMMSAAVILAFMITPTIASISREVFRSIPRNQREAALGLGATKWESIRIAVLRPGVGGIVAAAMLGLGRALGETMAVTMVIGNRVSLSWSLFEPGQTMASLLANQYAEADSDLHLAALTGVGFSLFVVSLLINSAARLLVARVESGLRGSP